MNERKPSDIADRVVVRTPDGMRKRLNALAEENGRTANAEAVKAFEAWLAQDAQRRPGFDHLPEAIRDKLAASARVQGRSVLDEVIARLGASFEPPETPRRDGVPSEFQVEIRDAMQEVIESLLADPGRLRQLGYAPSGRMAGEDPVSE